MNSPEPINRNRVIRVFVSSTFRDMQGERNNLVKFIFPQLRKICGQRGVAWGEVDLRWGVTDEQKAEGKVLPICLEEIKRCRPYFIGILGNRYGWVPDEIPQDLIEKEEWLKHHHDHSVTELEILHGVLRNPEMTKHAFFYFRDTGASVKVEEELRKEADYKPESEISLKKLEALKETIRQKGFPVRENYPDPRALGEMVLEDMKEVINKLYPEDSLPDPLDRDASDHEIYAQSRSRVYIGREEYFTKLDEHVSGDGPPLVITGDSGSGKSALLSNWALRFRKNNPGIFLMIHFIGASPFSSDWAAMLRRIMGEFKRRFDIQLEIPDKPGELRSAFANWLHMVSARGRLVLILDALNQLEDRDGAPDLVWLPPFIPSNVRMILSTLPGRPLDDIQKRSWKTMTIEPFNDKERKLFISEYLKQFTKSLGSDHTAYIVSNKQTANPLYLRALLEELRIFGRHEDLHERISFYLEAKTVPELYGKILARYEEDYESERPGLVKDVMTSIWAARRGLQESELLDIIGTDGNPLPRAIWTPLYLAAENSLVDRSGLIGFSHEYLRKAVQDKYILSESLESAVHLRVADYFSKPEVNPRVVDELPWQYMKAKEWQRLKDLLTQPAIFMKVWDASRFDVKTYWAKLESNLFSKVDAYSSVSESPEQEDPEFVDKIATLLIDSGHPSEALTLREKLTEIFLKSGDKYNYQLSLGKQGVILYRLGELDECMKLYKDEERICREMGEKKGLSISLGNQANVFYAHGEIDEAMRLNIEKEHICRQLGDKSGLSTSLHNQALIFYDRGHLEEALRFYKEHERVCRESGDLKGLQDSLGNQAGIFYTQGDLDEAMSLIKEGERICRELGDMDGLQWHLGNQAAICIDRGELDEALILDKEQEHLCRQLGNKYSLQISLGNQAVILKEQGNLDEAMRLHKEEESICRDLRDRANLQRSLGNQAVILRIKGELDEALRLHKQGESICRELGNKNGLQRSLLNQATVLHMRGKYDEALKLLKEQESICRDLGNKNDLETSLKKQEEIHLARG
jgi:tetratricopeptide (TPR) repeat protein